MNKNKIKKDFTVVAGWLVFSQCILDFVMTYLLLRIMDVRSNGGSVREALRFGDVNTVRDTPETNSDTIEGEDEDVANERYRIEQIEHGSQNAEVSFFNFFFFFVVAVLCGQLG